MQKPEGLAKAAAVMAVVSALATMLTVWSPAPLEKRNAASGAGGQKTNYYRFPVPARSTWGGVGVAQERGTAAECREALGGCAPVDVMRRRP